MKPGLKLHKGHPAGRDPREMTREELRAAGHEPMSALQALRARCLDCCRHQEREVALCPAVDCPAWPFRTGTDPWRKPASEARREAARRTMAEINARRGKGNDAGSSGRPPDHGTEPPSTTGTTAGHTWIPGGADRVPSTELHREERDRRERGRDELSSALPPPGSKHCEQTSARPDPMQLVQPP
jgi:hypothetical protein